MNSVSIVVRVLILLCFSFCDAFPSLLLLPSPRNITTTQYIHKQIAITVYNAGDTNMFDIEPNFSLPADSGLYAHILNTDCYNLIPLSSCTYILDTYDTVAEDTSITGVVLAYYDSTKSLYSVSKEIPYYTQKLEPKNASLSITSNQLSPIVFDKSITIHFLVTNTGTLDFPVMHINAFVNPTSSISISIIDNNCDQLNIEQECDFSLLLSSRLLERNKELYLIIQAIEKSGIIYNKNLYFVINPTN